MPRTERHHGNVKIEDLLRCHREQGETIRALRYHSGLLRDALQETLVSVLSNGPNSKALELAMQVLLDVPEDIAGAPPSLTIGPSSERLD